MNKKKNKINYNEFTAVCYTEKETIRVLEELPLVKKFYSILCQNKLIRLTVLTQYSLCSVEVFTLNLTNNQCKKCKTNAFH